MYCLFLECFKVIYIEPVVYLCNPLLAAAIIASVAGLGSAAMNSIASRNAAASALQASRETNAANAAAVDRANRANLNLYREQFRDTLNLYNMNNEYNSPVNEVNRLRAAGLNPALVYGSSSSASPVSLPSLPKMEAERYETAPYAAFSDTNFMHGVLDALPVVADSLTKMSSFSAQNIDNMTRDEMNLRTLENLKADVESKLANKHLSDSLREKYKAELEGVSIMNRLQTAKFDDSVKLAQLQSKFQEIQNRVLDESNSRDAARLAIEQYNSKTQRDLSTAQIQQINVLSNLAINADWREQDSHVMEMNLKALDQQLKAMTIPRQQKIDLFEDIIRNSELMHTTLKDKSVINKACEWAFGLGFRDIGTALRNLLNK